MREPRRSFWLLTIVVPAALAAACNRTTSTSPSQRGAQSQPPAGLFISASVRKGLRDDDWLAGMWDDQEAAQFAAEANRLLWDEGNVGEAIVVTRELLARSEQVSEDDFRKVVVTVNEHVRMYHAAGADYTAFRFAEQLTTSAKNRAGETVVYGVCLGNLGELYRARGDWLAAEKLLSEAADIIERQAQSHRLLLPTLASLGELYRAMGEYAKAGDALDQALKLVRQQRVAGPDHIVVLNTLGNLALEMGRNADAEQLLLEARQIKPRRNLYVYMGPGFPTTSGRIATSSPHEAPGPYDPLGVPTTPSTPGFGSPGPGFSGLPGTGSARPGHVAGSPLGRPRLPGDPGRGPTMPGADLASEPAGQFGAPPPALDRIRARIVQRQRIGRQKYSTGRRHAERVWGRATGPLPTTWGAVESVNVPSVDHLLNSIETETILGSLYARTGEYAKAEQHLKQAAEQAKDKLGDNALEYVAALNHLGRLHAERGDFAAAANNLHEARTRCQSDHPLYTLTLFNLAVLHQEKGDYAQSASLMEDLLQLELQRVHEIVPLLSEAEALNFLAANLRVRDPLLVSLDNLPETDALRAYVAVWRTRALATRTFVEIRRRVHKRPEAQAIQAALLLKRQQLAQVALAETALQDGDQRRRQVAELTEQKEQLQRDLAEISRRLQQEPGEKSAGGSAAALRQGGPLSADPEGGGEPDKESLGQVVRYKSEQLNQVIQAKEALEDDALRREKLEALAEQKQRLQRQLDHASRQLHEIGPAGREQSAGTAAVEPLPAESRPTGAAEPAAEIGDLAARLPAGVAVVDIIQREVVPPRRAGRAGPEPGLHYDAFVLRGVHDDAEPSQVAWVKLGASQPINAAIAAWRGLLRRPTRRGEAPSVSRLAPSAADSLQSPALLLRRLIWEKLEPHLSGCRTVIVIPDQDLTRVPWAALPGRRPGAYLLEEYAIGTGTHGHGLRDLLSRPPDARSAERVLVLGGVDYDRPPRSPTPPGPDVLAALGSRTPLGHGTQWPYWPPLAGTVNEIETIRGLWDGRGPIALLSGTEADKRRLYDELPRSRYVHLATHGFFADPKFPSIFQHDLPADHVSSQGNTWSARYWEDSSVSKRNPLLLSGLALAGANRPPKTDDFGLPSGNHGVLTAEEIVDLELSENDLVVLSACETGLGNVAGGEGVFGLQRAFHLAGARTVVASLWAVDDAATHALMVEFYKNLWEKKLGKLEALRQAQLTMLREYDSRTGKLRGPGAITPVDPDKLAEAREIPRTESEPLPPFYWAAFVLSGDWK